jgi:hypothetical protein
LLTELLPACLLVQRRRRTLPVYMVSPPPHHVKYTKGTL